MENREQQTIACGPKTTFSLNTVLLKHSFDHLLALSVYGCFNTTSEKSNNYDRGHKAQNIYYLPFTGKVCPSGLCSAAQLN